MKAKLRCVCTERLTVFKKVNPDFLQLSVPSILFGSPRHHSPDFGEVSNRFSQAGNSSDAIQVRLIGSEVVARRARQIVKDEVHFSTERGKVLDVLEDLRCPAGPIETEEIDPTIVVAFLKVDVFGQRVVLLEEIHQLPPPNMSLR